MKKIKSFADVEYIINNKIDVKDDRGYTVTFVRFLNLTLLQIVTIINDRSWEYSVEY
jgi:hypothetical protein